jgi:hypothetical protein
VRFVVIVLLVACRPPGWDKHDPPDASAAPIDASTTIDAALDTPAAATCDHAFRLDGHATATSVWLTGDFVSWAPSVQAGAIEFVQGVDSAWTGAYAFAAGTHQYKFIVDGTTWIPDPTNQNQIDDGFGGKNSLYTCVP